MSSIYVVPVEIRDERQQGKTFWLEALLWVWDASQFWEVVRDDLNSRGYVLVSFGEARNWHHERYSWPDNALVEQAVNAGSKDNQLIWCENRIPIPDPK